MYEETQVLDSLKVQPYYNSLAYDIFIDEGIDSPAYYRSVISTLNKASENDQVNMIINSGGGLVHTASAIIHAMDRCKARITAHLVGDCCSAATMISLHADEWEISDNVTFMVHTCSFMVGNSAEKIKDHHDFIQQSNRDTMYREYTGLLTDEEIERCLAGKEFWFNKEELEVRLQNFIQHKSQQQSSAMQEMFNLQNEQSDKYESLLLDKLVEKGVISKEDAAIAKKVQQASVELDEVEGETLFAQLNASQEEQCCGECTSEEDFLEIIDINGNVWKAEIIATDEGYTLGGVYHPETDEDFVCNSLYLSDAYDIEGLRGIADIFDIDYKKNVGKSRLAAKIVNYFEAELEEFLES